MVRVGLALGDYRAAAAGHRAAGSGGARGRRCRPASWSRAEVITGLWLGWLARLLVLALPVAGQFIAYMLGVANVLQPDPELGGQATPIARLFAIAAPLAILVTGLYALPLAALAGSYPADPARHAAARGGYHRNRGARRGDQLCPGDPPGLAVPAGRPSCGTSRSACSPGWCRACRSISWPCPDRSSAALRCWPSWRQPCSPPGRQRSSRLRQPAGHCDPPWPTQQDEEKTEAATPRRLQRARERRPGAGLARADHARRPGGGDAGSGHGGPGCGAGSGVASQHLPGAGPRSRRRRRPRVPLGGPGLAACRGAVRAGGDARRRGYRGPGADALPAERAGAAAGLFARSVRRPG